MSDGSKSFLGKIGPLSLWNKILSTDEISTLYNGGSSAVLYSGYIDTTLTGGLESHWDLTENSGSIRLDSTLNAHNLSEAGAVQTRLGFSNHNSFTVISSWRLDARNFDRTFVGDYDGSNDGRAWLHHLDLGGETNDIKFRVNYFKGKLP